MNSTNELNAHATSMERQQELNEMNRPSFWHDERVCRTQTNQANSPLLRLPAELRNIIYEFALTREKLEITHKRMRGQVRVGLERHPLALLQTCSQINKETAMLPYALNVFALPGVLGMMGDDYWKLNEHIGVKQLQAIKAMHITTWYANIRAERLEDIACFKGLQTIEIWDDQGWCIETLIRRIQECLPRVVVSRSDKVVTWKWPGNS